MAITKGVVSGILFCLCLSWCRAQHSEPTKLFAMIYTTGKSWDTSKEYQEQPYFMAHSRHLVRLRKSGVLPIGGRFSDKGFLLLRARDEEEANQIVQMDSSVRYGTFRVDIYPFDTFFEGCIDTKQE